MERQRRGGESRQGEWVPGRGDAQGGWGSEAAVTEGWKPHSVPGGHGDPQGGVHGEEKNRHLDQSADAVPLAMRSLPGVIFLDDTHSERRPFPEEKRPDVTADAFSFYFWWPWRSQFCELLPNDSPGNWWQNSHWLQEGQGWAFNNSIAFVCAAKPPRAPVTGPVLIRMVQT